MNTFPVKASPPSPEADLRKTLEKLKICVSQLKTPMDPEWPNSEDFLTLRWAILILDPKSDSRSRHHPRWKQSVAAVDKAFRDLFVRKRIERFLKRAQTILDAPDWVPPTIELMISKAGSHPNKDHKFEKTAMVAKAITSGDEQATGKHVAALLSLCSDKFRSLCKAELSSPDHIPAKWKPFVEYSAAIEIMREHRAYNQHYYNQDYGRQLIGLGEFLAWLGNSEFADFQEKIANFIFFLDQKELDKEKQKKQSLKRKKKERRQRGSKK